VNEVDLDGQVIHVKSLAMPKSSNGSDEREAEDNLSTSSRPGPMEGIEADAPVATNEATDHGAAVPAINGKAKDDPPTWSNGFDTALESFLSKDTIEALKTMFLEGREPPRVCDDGWAGRQVNVAEGEGAASSAVVDTPSDPSTPDKNGRKGQQERGGRGGRGGRGARGGRTRGGREDNRKVYSQVGPHFHVTSSLTRPN
jgi:tRNA pseudouridine13 synthase